MTIKDLRIEINQSEHKDFFKSCTVHINYPHIDFTIDLKGIDAIYGFVLRQNKGWNSTELPSYLNNSKEHFKKLKSQLLDLVNGGHYNIESKWQQIKALIQKQETNNRTKVFTSDSSITKFLEELHKENPNYVKGAYNFIIGQNETINTNDLLTGLIRAYEYKNQGRTDISKRRSNERAAISTIRNSFENYVSETEGEINEVLDKSKENLIGQTAEIDGLLESKKTEFNEWLKSSQNGFSEFDVDSKKKITDLEDTYRKKLQLEAPARYWRTKSNKYREDAIKARNILLTMVAVSGIFFAIILITSPDWIFKTVFKGNATAIVRWSIVFIALISLLAFAVKAITKVMFSSFHLARDAEERHTLTFFYLALLKDTNINDDDRKLILQSLFSRAETGLLKDDSGPTMPNDLIGKIIGK
ncbi:hypothetical protein AX016_0359 [Cellulophaga sp. RHA19]|uniref:DUF6161 domain-containing protein n=1 Tax=Cellulophaga sp. RHA19 TaxID=1798237 RepID=UPI000C2BE8F3|nr:DUF6161 domain-containing protein [Cellulophaga sp. RHA19]PKB42197.1 hypothetical protein AX016_0359 [Cellulophaga sp. RHA19]